MAVVALVVGGVAVVETVGQHEINVGVLPGEIVLTHHLRSLQRDCVDSGLTAVPYGIGDHILPTLQRSERMVGICRAVDGDIHRGILGCRGRRESGYGSGILAEFDFIVSCGWIEVGNHVDSSHFNLKAIEGGIGRGHAVDSGRCEKYHCSPQSAKFTNMCHCCLICGIPVITSC